MANPGQILRAGSRCFIPTERTQVTAPTVVVTFALDAAGHAVVVEALDGAGEVVAIADADPASRAAALRRAGAVMAWNPGKELRPEEFSLMAGAKLIQLLPAGIDFIRFADLPAGVPVASNAGAYRAPMAEHALAMALAAAKRLVFEHGELAHGRFNQGTRNRRLAGGVCGILGFGGIGSATATLMRALGMRIHAVNRRGASDAPTDWIGGIDQLDMLLAASDVLVIAAPLTRATLKLIDARALGLMKPDAILINLARGEIIEEEALYRHLVAHPGFTACIDAWWIEPVRHGVFRMDFPFMTLPNVIGSPHNSANAPGTTEAGLRQGAANCRRALLGETPHNLVGPEDRLL
jgi:phosphoglycerate dehydrogenase-like enzyme